MNFMIVTDSLQRQRRKTSCLPGGPRKTQNVGLTDDNKFTGHNEQYIMKS